MRFLPSLFFTILVFTSRHFAQGSDFPTVTGTIPNQSVVTTVGTPPIDLRSFFAVTSVTGQAVQFTTVKGTFNVEMNAAAAPSTVANFLAYVNANSFTN